eukprot:TRINITY_DN5150_c0_g1_i1.p1 TRINITY_DN5150_c0_g1~~TRINITY_DN5150_c0_g1_i1.p1  ORF type:complete len:207 (+),score=36.39 TRINITY_DN5150_c0_g1_i1:94-714(+)
MEVIVSQLLGKYLKIFIKGYSHKQLDVQFFKGTATLTNLELHPEALQELLWLPSHFQIVLAKVSAIKFDLPGLTRLSNDPLKIILDDLELEIAEPVHIKPMSSVLRGLSDEETKKEQKICRSSSKCETGGEKDENFFQTFGLLHPHLETPTLHRTERCCHGNHQSALGRSGFGSCKNRRSGKRSRNSFSASHHFFFFCSAHQKWCR